MVTEDEALSQSPDEDSLSSDTANRRARRAWRIRTRSQSPDEDSLSSDHKTVEIFGANFIGLNPLTRIHCLPTIKLWKFSALTLSVSIP